MSFSINTNVSSLQVQNYLRVNSDFQSKTISRVTSGLRIVSSGDDAAGLAIANGLRSDQAVLNQGIRNANDGLSQLQIADGGMNNISQLLDRARTLATQSASGTFTGDRNVLNSEFTSVMSEIDRQAQAIGLNKGGTFAKSLSVFIGGGKGSSDAAVISDGSVGLDLSKSTVDTNSLGLNTYRAENSKTYDLTSTSDTSVSKIINDANTAGVTNAHFYFQGSGFGDSAAGVSPAIDVNVDLSGGGITDTATLAAAVNQAIYNAATANTNDNTTAFKAAGISASVVTDSSGHQELAFNSSSTAFQVSGNQVGNAFLGMVADSRAGQVTGEGSTYVQGKSTLQALSGATDLKALTYNINGAGATAFGAGLTFAGATSQQQIVDAINTKLGGASDIQADLKDGKLNFYSKTGAEFTIAIANDGSDRLGFSGAATASSSNALLSGGVYQSAQEPSTSTTADHSTAAYTWKDISATDSQTLTVSTKRPDGTVTGLDIQMGSSSGGAVDVTSAINTINDALQNSKDPNLQGIVAVRDGAGISFMNAQQGFSVKLADSVDNAGASTGTNEGLAEIVNGTTKQGGVQVAATTQGTGGAADISSQASAQSAVTALSNAVSVLGQAQAVVGRGQNQFNYAINLAQSQTTNMASAESRIRDADLASEAANLTKAQVLIQAGIAALAQANSAPQQVLSLLKG